ncbi:MAG: invasion associated locus B family protein [Erythrobacter sp.]|nr:invasion associated locus B family protein [Erythrobacter sp.]
MPRRALLTLLVPLILAAPLAAKDSLGVFESWGAFRDPSAPRCYAIAMAEKTGRANEAQPFATIATWPRRNVRGQVHFRFSRELRRGSAINLVIGRETFRLTGNGTDGWARDRAMDAAIVAAMRSEPRMTVRGITTGGRRLSDTYPLAGAASAMDAATLGCARR